jgi:hypothetical protein
METKSQPVSLRLSPAINRFVTSEAKRTRRSKGAILLSLIDEAMRIRQFPGIAFRGTDWSRRAWITGTALDVWEAIECYRSFGTVEQMSENLEISERQVKLALDYYRCFPEEIDEAIAENSRPIDELLREFPTAQVYYSEA